jgi:vancomycin permeability regulator SanA
MRLALARGTALFFGCFSLLNLAGDWIRPGFDANLWWIDTRALPPWLNQALFLCAGTLLVAWGIRPACSGLRRRSTSAVLWTLLLIAVINGAVFYGLWFTGRIHPGLPVPVSFLVAATFGWLVVELRRPPSDRPIKCPAASGSHTAWVGVAFAAWMVFLPLTQVIWFGNTDYRQRADAIVVFGARAYADGRPSDALADRVRAGCELYRAGLAPRLIFSGGPGDGAVHETEAMRRMAVAMGVPAEAIVLDPAGVNTRATVEQVARWRDPFGVQHIVGVSHFYHLARIRLACQRSEVQVRTVPAHQTRFLAQIPYSVAREVVALWAYYFAGLYG